MISAVMRPATSSSTRSHNVSRRAAQPRTLWRASVAMSSRSSKSAWPIPDGPGIMAERLVKAISSPFEILGQQTMIGTSIGIALYPSDGDTGEDLVRAADTALYRAKEAG